MDSSINYHSLPQLILYYHWQIHVQYCHIIIEVLIISKLNCRNENEAINRWKISGVAGAHVLTFLQDVLLMNW